MSAAGVQAYLEQLPRDDRVTVDAIRAIVTASHPALDERIKWNGPSFALGGQDRITLGIMPKGGVRVVLHRGAKAKDLSGFRFDDVDELATWPNPDRGVLTFQDVGSVMHRSDKLRALFARWLEASA